MALAFVLAGRFDKAIAAARHACELDEADAGRNLLLLGWAYAVSGQFDAAVDAATRAHEALSMSDGQALNAEAVKCMNEFKMRHAYKPAGLAG